MTPRLGSAPRDIDVLARGSAHEHGVRPLRERIAEIGEDAQVELLFHISPAIALERFGQDVAEAALTERQQLEIVAVDAAQVPRMPLSNRAESCDQNPHVSPRAAGSACSTGIHRAAGTATSLQAASIPSIHPPRVQTKDSGR